MGNRTTMAFAVALASAMLVACAQDGARGLREPTAALQPDETLVTLDSRPGVTVRLLVTTPPGAPRGIFLLFPGGEGFLVNRNGGFYGAFRRPFVELGYVTAVIDTPSDQPAGMEDGGGPADRFRIGADHVRDARAAIGFLTAGRTLPVFLMGHSMGAISVAHIAATLDDPRLRGVVLAASPTERQGGMWVSVPNAALHRIAIPVLLVHHRDDGCRGSTFFGASDYPRLFVASPRVAFVPVSGGSPPQSANPCVGNNRHSFFGIRGAVVKGIVRWFGGEDVTEIGP